MGNILTACSSKKHFDKVDDFINVSVHGKINIAENDEDMVEKNVVENILEKVNETNIFYRPWGWYKNIEEKEGYKVKIICVNIGQKLSLQSHNYRSEHWVIVKGNAKVQLGENHIILNKNEHVYIPINEHHRIENIGDELLEFTETQIGVYLGEDDIIRYEDDYGRI